MAFSQQEGSGSESLMPPSGWDEDGNWTGQRSASFGVPPGTDSEAPSLIDSRETSNLYGFDKEVLREPGESNRDFGRRLAVLQHTPKTADDYWSEFEWSDLVPYWSSGEAVVEMKGLYDAVSRIDEGNATRDDEKQVLEWLIDMQRPTTFGHKVADIGMGSIPFMGEMAVSGGVSGLVKAGGMKTLRMGLEKAAAELGERAIGKAAAKMAQKAATKQLDDVLLRGAGEIAERGALATLGRGALRTGEITATSEMISSMVGEGGRIEANTYGRALPDMGIAADPQDASRLLVMMDGSIGSFTEALPEGALEALFETGSEMMGGALTKYSGLDRLRGFQLKIFSDLKDSGKWSRRMQKGLEAGQWHGIVGEWLEERANAAMQAATPGMFEEAGWLDVIPSIEQGLAEIVAFGATGGAMHGGGLALDKMLEPAAVEQRGEGFLGGRPQGAAPETQQKPLTQPEQVANKLGRAVSDMETQNGVRYQPVAAEEDPRVGSLERALARVGVDLVVVAPSAEAGAAEADAGSDASERRVPVPAMWAAEGVVVLDSSVLDSPGATEALIAHEVEVHNNLEQARTRGEDALAPLLDVLEAASPGLLAEYRAEYARRYESSEQAQRGAEMATAAEAQEAAEELIDAGDQHGGVALWGGYVRSQGARTDGDVQILDLMPSQKIIDAQRSERPALAEDALSEEAVATAAEQGFLRNLRAVLRTAKGQKLARQLYAGNRTKLQQLVDAIKGVVRRLGITLETREAAALRKLEQLLVAKIPANVDSREAVEAARALEQFVGIAEQRRTAEQATPPTARGQQAESQPATSEAATPLVAPALPEQEPEPEMASLPQAVAPQAVEARENAPASAGGVAEMPRTAPNMFGETEERALERPEVAEEATQTGQLFQDDTGARGQTSILDTQESVPTPAMQPEAQAVQSEAQAMQPEAQAVQPEAQAVQPEAQAVQPESEEPAPAKTREPKKPLTPQQKKVNRRIAGRKAFKARVARYAAAEEGVRFVQWLRAKGGVNLSQGDLSDYTDPAYAHYNDGGVGLPRAVHKHGMTVDRLWEEIRDAGWFASIGRHDLQPGYSTGETYNESESRAADVAVLMQLLDENPTKRESEEWIEEAEEAYNQAQYDQYDAQFYDALGDVAEANGYSDALHEGLQKAYREERISYTQVADLLEGSGMSAEAAQALLDEAEAKPRFALAPGSPAELDAQGQQRLEEALRQSPNGDVVRSLLEEYANTPWARQAIKGAQARAALDLLLSGETPEFESVFGAPGQRALAEAIRSGGAEVIWNRLAQNSIIGHPSKPLNAVNASFLNCEPTLECASSCYAANGMAARAGNVVKAELVEWAVRTDPVRAGKLAATQYKGMGEFFKKKALRLFDKGDGQMYWVPFIKALNAEGVRTQVFSKHAEFLRQVPSLNLRLYSVDAQNMEAARAESDLPVAFVYTGTDAEVDWIREHSDRVQVVLPIKMGAKTLDAALQAKLEQGAAGITPKICPVDRGKVKIGKDASGPLKENWDCTRCDQGGGVGCFYKNTTSQVLKASRSIEDTIQEANDEWKATVRQVAKALDGPARSDVLAELDALLRQARGNSDSEAEAGFDPRAAGAARRSRGGEEVHRGGSQRGDAQGDQLDAYDPKFAVAPSTDSPEFQRWFENSKVVDADGKPLVVYHGTSVPGGFTQFSREHLRSEGAFFFTSDPEEASDYSEDSPTGLGSLEGGRPQVMPVYLSIKNPYPGHRLAKAGEYYDGEISYRPDGSILWAVVYDPEQIKSAIGNRGTYDPADPDLRRAVTAYHGTVPEFDSFSTDKINTGEGNQAYGWGLYFASRKRIAEYYRRKLSGGGLRAQLDGKDISRDSRPEEIPAYAWGALWEGNLDKAIARLRRDMEWYAEQVGDEDELFSGDDPAELAQRLADTIRWLEENRDRISYRKAGAGYTVELAPEEDEYLLWDRPLEEQSEKVQEALGWNQSARDFSDEMKRIFRDYLGSGDPARIAEGNRLLEEAERRPRHPLTDPIGSRHGAKGYIAYDELIKIKGSPKEASLYLHSQGVRGIKYLDGNSRSDGEGSYNYVIFDAADVQVTGRWAIAEPASGGVAPRVATAFSGMGTVEAALGAESVLAVELDAAVVEAHNQAHGSKWKPENVLALNPARIAAEDPDLFHASPVCKNCSTAKRGATIDKGDLAAGRKIAQVIREARPRAVTVENVPAYRHTVPYRLIVKALEEEGYFWDADLYNAAEYGGAQSRRRLIVRARRDRPLPPMPAKRPAADWYDLIKDLLPDAKSSRLPKWERQRIDAMAEKGLLDLASPVLTMGGTGFSGRANAVNAGQPAPTLVSSEKSVPRILLPDGRTVRVSGRMMARLMGLADSVQVPTSDRLAKRVLGNGVHGVISRDVIGPVADIKGQSRFAVTAHHGSPHNFDRFSTAKIGTGEGAQAYGWGLYFASRKEVAEHYKQSLSGPYRSGGNVAMDGWMYFLDGELQNEEAVKIDLLGDIFAYNNDRGALRDRLVHMRDWHLSERDRILDGGSRNGPYDAQGHDFKSTQYAGDIRRLDALPPGVVTRQKPGAGYTVELAPEEDEYLLWDEPLSKQSEKVRGALVQVERYGSLFSEEAARDDDNAMAGSNAYRTLSRGLLASGVAGEFGNPDQAASQALHAAGIRGIKYLDGTSRSKGEGSFNYVIFDDADVEITGRFALGDLNRPQDPQNQGYFPYVSDSLERAEEMTDKEALTSGLNALNSPPERKKQKSFSYLEEALQRATTPSGENVRAADPSTQIDIDPDNLPVLGDRVHLEEVFKAWLGNRQVAEEWAKSQAARRERELIRIVDELAPRDFKDILRESASAEPNRVAVREMDEAIHLWIDLGDRAEEQFAKWGGKLTDKQRRVYELSQNLPPAVRELAESIRAENQARGRLLKDAGVIQSIVDGYSARIWEAGTDGISIPFGLGRFKLNTDRAKEREFESTLHGWAKGRELRVKGAIGSQLAARLETAQVLHDRNLLETAKRYRVISSKQHEGWERVEHPNFRPWKIVGKMPAAEWESMSPQEREEQFATYSSDLMITESGEVLARQDAYAPKQLARALNKALGKSTLMDIGWIRALTRAQAKLKATILYTSLFHHQAYLRSYGLATEAFDGDLKNLNPYEAMRRGREAIERFGPEVQDLVRAGLTIGSTRDLEEDLLEEQTIIGRMIDKVPGAAEFSHTLEAMRRQQTNYLFHRMGPQLKIQAALLDYRHRLHVNRAELEAGTITRREIAEAIAEKVNNDFGGLNLQRLKINPTNWHIARLLLLAPDWTYSNVRSMVQAFRRGEVGRVHRALWGAVAVRGLIATVGFNLLMAAMPTDDDKDKRFTRRFLGRYQRAWDEGHMRWLDADVTPLYELFAQGEGKRKYFSLIGHFRDPVKFLGNPVRSLKHKASPGASAVYEALSGTDWAGRQFTTTPELLGMDDKGVYASSRKGKDGKYVYRKGDPKGGKLAGQTVSWKSESRGPINFTNLPSFTIARTKAALPVQVQNLLAFVAGEQDAFDTITKSMGLMTSTTRPKEED